MKRLRKHLTYANVMASIAVFLVLGGGAAFAAGKLAKNSVGTKQLKANSVTTAKIKKDAVTGAKVKESTLGEVPSATNAGNANTANGQTVHKIRGVLTEGQSNVPIATIAGFTLSATCGVNDADLEIIPPTGPGTDLFAGGIPMTGTDVTTRDWAGNKPGENGGIEVDHLSAGGDASYGVSSIDLTTTDGKVVSGTLAYDYDAFENSSDCIFFGHLIEG